MFRDAKPKADRPLNTHADEAGASPGTGQGGSARSLLIEPAGRGSAAALTALAIRSKAHWGYDAAFLRACEADLTVRESDLSEGLVFAARREEALCGFYSLAIDRDQAELTRLFVEPRWIGAGVGAALWRHAVSIAAGRGRCILRIEADPFAEGFYRRMGAVRTGECPSIVGGGRMLPVLEYALPGGR